MAATHDDDYPEDDLPPDDDGGDEAPAPLTGREKARRLFFELIKDCGTDLIRMPSSCRIYLNRYLAHHPDEADLLAAVLLAGVPNRLLAYEATSGYTDFLNAQIEEFVQTSHLTPPDAKWAVDTWATALGRPRGFKYVPPVVDPAEFYPDPEKDKKYDNFVKAAMLFIVAAGGFFGTFMAVALMPVIAWAFEVQVIAQGGMMFGGDLLEEQRDNQLGIFLIAFVAAAGFGVVGAAAAIMGWLFAGGEEEPWATAAVASGTAFTSVFACIFALFLCCVPPLFFPFIHIFCVFGATYKSAARGGNY